MEGERSKGGGGSRRYMKEDEEEDGGGEDPSARHRSGVWAQESDATPMWSHTERIIERLRGI